MKKNMSLTEILFEDVKELTMDELCQACAVSPDFIVQIIEFGIIEPRGGAIESWRFEARHLHRLRIVVRLQRDLEVNLAGAALAVELLEEMEVMKNRLQMLEKHFLSL